MPCRHEEEEALLKTVQFLCTSNPKMNVQFIPFHEEEHYVDQLSSFHTGNSRTGRFPTFSFSLSLFFLLSL